MDLIFFFFFLLQAIQPQHVSAVLPKIVIKVSVTVVCAFIMKLEAV